MLVQHGAALLVQLHAVDHLARDHGTLRLSGYGEIAVALAHLVPAGELATFGVEEICLAVDGVQSVFLRSAVHLAVDARRFFDPLYGGIVCAGGEGLRSGGGEKSRKSDEEGYAGQGEKGRDAQRAPAGSLEMQGRVHGESPRYTR